MRKKAACDRQREVELIKPHNASELSQISHSSECALLVNIVYVPNKNYYFSDLEFPYLQNLCSKRLFSTKTVGIVLHIALMKMRNSKMNMSFLVDILIENFSMADLGNRPGFLF